MTSAKIPGTHASCASSACCDVPSPVALANPSPVVASSGSTLWRISTMDCASEEGEIRRALEPIAGIRSLSFQLGARTLAIDADQVALQPALEAIRKAGFSPQPVADRTRQISADNAASDQSHAEHDHHDHDHGDGEPDAYGRLPGDPHYGHNHA